MVLGVYLAWGCTYPGGTWSRGVPGPRGNCSGCEPSLGGVPGPGGVPDWGVPAQGLYLVWGCTCPGVPAQGCTWSQRGVPGPGVFPWSWGGYLPRYTPCGQTDTCKNITFANFVCER